MSKIEATWEFEGARVDASCEDGALLLLDFFGTITPAVMSDFAAREPRMLLDLCPAYALLASFEHADLDGCRALDLTQPMLAPAALGELFLPAAIVCRREDLAVMRAHCAAVVPLGIVREAFTIRVDARVWVYGKVRSARAALRRGRPLPD